MTTPAHHIDVDALQRARAERLRELLEPWSLRRLEARTGIGRGTLQGRLNGTTALTMGDIEVLAPLIRMTPEELFSDLRAVEPSGSNGPRSGAPAGQIRSIYMLDGVGPAGIEPTTSTV